MHDVHLDDPSHRTGYYNMQLVLSHCTPDCIGRYRLGNPIVSRLRPWPWLKTHKGWLEPASCSITHQTLQTTLIKYRNSNQKHAEWQQQDHNTHDGQRSVPHPVRERKLQNPSLKAMKLTSSVRTRWELWFRLACSVWRCKQCQLGPRQPDWERQWTQGQQQWQQREKMR
jgi:hypothetical protein